MTAVAEQRILIVEDDEPLKTLFPKLLREKGYEVDFADNGKSGLQLAEKNYYDLIYTGGMLPQMNGVELLRELKAKGVKHGKIVVFSIMNHKEFTDELLELGVDKYVDLGKINIEQGLQIIEGLLIDNENNKIQVN